MITLLHPSRGRPSKSSTTSYAWFRRSSSVNNIEHIVSVDKSDSELDKYISIYGQNLIINPNTCVVDATNQAAKRATGDILVYLSDDFDCPNGWDSFLINEFAKYSGPTLIKVDDCLQKFDTPVLTIPIMNRALYEKLGYFWHPDYKSMFVDEDLYWTAQKLGALRMAPHLKFPHEHHSIGKAQNDETYRRSEANWNQGKDVFNRRRRAGFPV